MTYFEKKIPRLLQESSRNQIPLALQRTGKRALTLGYLAEGGAGRRALEAWIVACGWTIGMSRMFLKDGVKNGYLMRRDAIEQAAMQDIALQLGATAAGAALWLEEGPDPEERVDAETAWKEAGMPSSQLAEGAANTESILSVSRGDPLSFAAVIVSFRDEMSKEADLHAQRLDLLALEVAFLRQAVLLSLINMEKHASRSWLLCAVKSGAMALSLEARRAWEPFDPAPLSRRELNAMLDGIKAQGGAVRELWDWREKGRHAANN